MKSTLKSPHCSRLPAWTCWGLAAVCVAIVAFLRLSPATTHIVPIAFSIPLIAAVWCNDKRLVWAMAACFAVISMVRAFVVSPDPSIGSYRFLTAGMLLFDVAAIAAGVHLLINARRNVHATSQSLDLANMGLEKQNQQLEELNQQFVRREAALQTLLAATRWDVDHGSGNQVISKIAAAVIPLMGGDVSASAVVQRDGHWLRAIGYSGFATDALEQTAWPLKNSFALSVMERGQTDFIENLSKRPEVIAPMAAGQPSIRSLISTPLRLGGQINGAIEAYSRTERKWTAEDIKIMEWLAAQTSLAMEIVLLQRELEQRRRDAVGESVRKTRFLVAISHDVRTPANAINLLSELMVRSSEDPEKAGDMRRLALEMRQSADALTELIGDVLDVSSFDSGQVQLDVLEFPLDALLDREVARLRPLAEIKPLDLRCQLAGESVWLRTDRTKLSRVVTNLIANAIKFTPSGHVEVKRETRPDGAIEIHVTDTGVGIAQDNLEHIFDEFFQLTNPARDRSKGTGLGLAIGKRLASALGCELGVRSEPGKGAKFTITIPARLVSKSAAVRTTSTAQLSAKPLEGIPILLVEDHDPTRRATARLLAGFGAKVIQAETGTAAMQMLREESPEVLLLDLMLPDVDGSEVLKFLKQSPNQSLRQIYAVSGDVSPERADQVKMLGADDLIPKPVNIETLVRRITTRAA